MQRSIAKRSIYTTENTGIPTGPEPNTPEVSQGPNFCPLSDPKEDKRREIDLLIEEYDQHKTRMQQIHKKLHQLGVRPFMFM